MLFLVAFFCPSVSWAVSSKLLVTEIMYDADVESGHVEWIEFLALQDINFELKNSSGGVNQLKDFYICVKNNQEVCASYFAVYSPGAIVTIKEGEFFVITKDEDLFKSVYSDFEGIILRASSTFNLLKNDQATVAVSFDNKISWEARIDYGNFIDKGRSGFTLERIDNSNFSNDSFNWQTSFSKKGTPGLKNSQAENIISDESSQDDVVLGNVDENNNCSKEIVLSEILPNPSGAESENEYIEIKNNFNEAVNLDGWKIYDTAEKLKQDSDPSGEYGYEIGERYIEEYLIIYRRDFSFALYGEETVFLRDPCENYVSKAHFGGGSEDVSYNFDGINWRWSSRLSPGKINVFEESLKYEINIDKNIYKDVSANFEIISDDNKLKTTWDFGDGKKSYKTKVSHKYEKIGKYFASVKITGSLESVIRKFEIEVKKFPEIKIKINRVYPNPPGTDSGKESMTIENKSKKKINLKGWSIATGSSLKDLFNHPITEDFEIKAGKFLEITNEFSKFTLGNTQTAIELRYPDGKVAYEVEYKEDKEIKEGMVYEKNLDGKWEWKLEEEYEKQIAKGGFDWIDSGFGFGEEEDALEVVAMLVDELNRDIDAIYAEGDQENVKTVISKQLSVIESEIKKEDIGKKSEIEVENIFEKTRKYFIAISFPENYFSSPAVLGTNVLWVDEKGFYRFILESPQSEHYAIVFVKDIFSNINYKLNLFLNRFSK